MTARLRQSLDLMLGRRPPALQVGAVCVDEGTGRVLLITSRGTGRWIIPKGWPMAGRTLAGAAALEAWEEGGVEGRIEPDELGRYRYGKAQDCGFATPVEVRVFRLQVRHLAATFPEEGQRRREWFDPVQAAERVEEPGLKAILRDLRGGAAG